MEMLLMNINLNKNTGRNRQFIMELFSQELHQENWLQLKPTTKALQAGKCLDETLRIIWLWNSWLVYSLMSWFLFFYVKFYVSYCGYVVKKIFKRFHYTRIIIIYLQTLDYSRICWKENDPSQDWYRKMG